MTGDPGQNRPPNKPSGPVDPLGKRALFSPPPNVTGRDAVDRRGVEGVEALFSNPAVRDGHGSGIIEVACSGCGATTRIPLLDAVARMAFFSLWIPSKTYDRWLKCPACNRRTWCRLRLRG